MAGFWSASAASENPITCSKFILSAREHVASAECAPLRSHSEASLLSNSSSMVNSLSKSSSSDTGHHLLSCLADVLKKWKFQRIAPVNVGI
jgi:hypothetical protein